MDRAYAGTSTHMEDIRLTLLRNGYPEEAHFAFSYTPVPDGSGGVAGVFCTCLETTSLVRAQRHQNVLLALGDRLRDLGDPAAIAEATAETLGRHIGVAQVGYSIIEGNDAWLAIDRDWSDGRIPSVVGRHRMADFGAPLIDALRRGEAIAVQDVDTDPRIRGTPAVAAFAALSIRAVLAVPLVKQGRLRATLFLHDAVPRTWTRDELSLARDCAERTWTAVARAEAETRLRRRAEQLQALARTSMAVAAADGLEATLQEIAWAAKKIIGAHQSVVSLTADPAGGQMITAVALSEKYAAWNGYDKAPDGSGIYALVSETNRPVRLTQAEMEAHPRWRGFGSERASHPPMRGWLAVPLVARDGRNLGLVQLSDKRDGSDFDEDDEAILVQLAQHASTAVERRTAEDALRRSERRLSATWDNAGVGICEVDAEGRYLAVNHTFTRMTGYTVQDFAGKTFFDAILDPADRSETRAHFAALVRGDRDDMTRERAYIARNGRRWWCVVRTTAVRDDAGRFLYAVRVLQDITERKSAEERQFLLMREVDHRAKNVLAVVQAVVRLTRAERPSDFVEAVESRVAALARAHSLLARGQWTGAPLRDLAEAEIAPYAGNDGRSRFTLSGPSVDLAPDAVQPTAMVLHELATNAAKHGALSAPRGRVAIAWRPLPDGGIRIDWEESGGPAIAVAPRRQGFGSQMVAATAMQLDGEAVFTWAPTGLHCTLTIGRGHILHMDEAGAAADAPPA